MASPPPPPPARVPPQPPLPAEISCSSTGGSDDSSAVYTPEKPASHEDYRDDEDNDDDDMKAHPRFWSGKHRVPRIESYWELYPELSYSPEKPEEGGERDETERNRMRLEHTEHVTDPITGQNTAICDAKYAPPKEIGKTLKGGYPPEGWGWIIGEVRGLTVKLLVFVVAVFVLLNGWLGAGFTLSLVVVFAGAVTWWRRVDAAWETFRHVIEKERGGERMKTIGEEGNESVEWLNGVLSKLWPQVNSDIFTTLVDQLEDVMQASIPSIITQVKVVNVGQGSTPVRVLSVRWLDDEHVGRGTTEDSGAALTEKYGEIEKVGEWASLEVAFAYRARPSSASAESKAKNANLLVHFYMGMNSLFGTPIPVWVELRGATGVCRLKVQLVPDPPFVKLLTFTLLGMPKIEVAAVPLNQRFINVMNLPVISDFIYSSIRTTAKQFVAPASRTLDLSKILTGDDTKKQLLTIGVLVVHIHSGKDLKAADLGGKSDCYVTLSYSKNAKPLWSTRIIFHELNPCWDETAVLLLTADDVKASEQLRVQLWDSDRFTADDVLGRTGMDVLQLVKHPGKLFQREDCLLGVRKGSNTMPGRVKWDVVFYGNRALNKALMTDGKDERLPADLDHLYDPPIPKRLRALSETEADVLRIPPDPEYPSGILSVQIHNIVGLERHIVAGSKRSSITHPVQSHGTEEEEEGHNLPSAYCSIVVNSQKIYRTRIKPMTSKPFFNAGTERFVRDWRNTQVIVVVRDSRLREEDPILGIVDLKLADVLRKSSQISRYYPIRGGVGYGKIKISLLFRSIDAQLPPPVLGADIGSVEIISRRIRADGIADNDVAKADFVRFSTPLAREKAPRVADGHWELASRSLTSFTGPRLGVRHRHSDPLVLHFRRDSKLRIRDKTVAVAVLWLKDIPDDEVVSVELPVFRAAKDKAERVVQNCGDAFAGTERVGAVAVEVKFRRGVGRAHRRAAGREKDFEDVAEAVGVISAGDEEMESPQSGLFLHSNPSSAEEGGYYGEDGEEVFDGEQLFDISDEGGSVDSEKMQKRSRNEKRSDRKELHRLERGAMQWKAARTLKWVGKGVKDGARGAREKVRMESRRQEVESEV